MESLEEQQKAHAQLSPESQKAAVEFAQMEANAVELVAQDEMRGLRRKIVFFEANGDEENAQMYREVLGRLADITLDSNEKARKAITLQLTDAMAIVGPNREISVQFALGQVANLFDRTVNTYHDKDGAHNYIVLANTGEEYIVLTSRSLSGSASTMAAWPKLPEASPEHTAEM